MNSIAFQLDLRPELPNIYGNLDYTQFRETLIKIDEILDKGDLEYQLVKKAIDHFTSNEPEFINDRARQRLWKNMRFALRCNIARHLTGESFRKFSVRLSDSQLFQWFTRIHYFTKKKAISKSSLERFSKMFDEKIIDESLRHWMAGFLQNPKSANKIGLNDAIDCSELFADSTCVKANIHFPIDWVLLKDAVKSLLLAIKTIRTQGLKHRMPNPAEFLKKMNRLCIEMTHTRRKKDGRKFRKKILRKMKKLTICIQKHAKRYKDLLINNLDKTDWTPKQANQVIKRIDNILDQLPIAIHQAHERIIGERQVKSKNKILSLYEPDIYVIVRGKAGGEVEFGNGLILTEQRQGLILDWELFRDQPKSDSKLLKPVTKRIQKYYGSIKSMAGDRGFHSKNNDQFLDHENIFNAICPKSPKQLKERMKNPRFRELQTRRNQTEGRIGIFKNNFLGRPLRSKGFLYKQMAVSFCVLTHNLWLIARLAISDEKYRLEKAA